jgi:hypothetical protein
VQISSVHNPDGHDIPSTMRIQTTTRWATSYLIEKLPACKRLCA